MRLLLIATLIALGRPALAAVTLVEKGQAKAVVVLPEAPTSVASYAAEELAAHVEKATGVRLAIVAENAVPPEPRGRVYVGNCRAARDAGIQAGALASEEFILRAAGKNVFIAGRDGDGPALSTDTPAGTLWGVYELVDDVLKACWLWPGDLGTFVPRTQTVVVRDTDRTVPPRLMQRNLRSTLSMGGGMTGGFSAAAQKKVARDQAVWMRRMRMGRTRRLHYGHAFTNWWQLYGKEHPEWFNLLENGKREPPGGDVSMCVSAPGFHQQIIALWQERRKTDPETNINACENDIDGLCTCGNCRAWDGPQPKQTSERFGKHVVSDRYARYWLTVQQLAAKVDPNALVVAYAYVNYAPPPTTDIRLNEKILVGTVPDLFFPRTPAEQQWVKDQWAGWRKTGCRLFLRPNYTLEGYCMPHVFAHQFADEFLFEAKNGMVATDFDSLTAMWATHGPTLYLLGRLHTRPERGTEALLAEYYAGFGGAARQVKAYFDYWEKYTMAMRPRLDEVSKARRAGWPNYAAMADALFPPETFTEAGRLLDAAEKAATEADSRARVEFLRKGWKHAELCSRVAAVASGQSDLSPLAGGRALAELLSYRKQFETENVANLNYCAWVESRSWRLPEGYDGRPLKPLVEAPAALEKPVPMPARGGGSMLALLKAGERFQARVACQRIGKYDAACEWSLWGPDDRRVARGAVEAGKDALVEAQAPADGIYLLSGVSGGNVAQMLPQNAHAALVGRTLRFLGACGPLFFHVPAGTQRFTVTLDSPVPGETAKLTVFDCEGKQAGQASTGAQARQVLDIALHPGQAGRAWSLTVEKADTGVLEDYTITLDAELPPYWSVAADRLVVPEGP